MIDYPPKIAVLVRERQALLVAIVERHGRLVKKRKRRAAERRWRKLAAASLRAIAAWRAA